MSQQNELAAFRLQMTISESEALNQALNQAASSTEPEFLATLELVLDKVEDAETVARWLRENVTFKLDLNEIQTCHQAVARSLETIGSTSKGRDELNRLRETLAQALGEVNEVFPAVDLPLQPTCVAV